MQPLFVDLESRSRADIECTGSTKYAQHPSTEVLVMRYGYSPRAVSTWLPGQPVPEEFRDPRVTFIAHRTNFERAMFRYRMTPDHGFPLIPDSRWLCSAAAAGYAGLPQGLDKISDRLDLGMDGKDKAGHANMLTLCRPFPKKLPKLPPKKKSDPPRERRKAEKVVIVDGVYEGGEYNDDPERHVKNVAYCGRDVTAEITAYAKLPAFPERERRVWLLHNKINDRGIPVDLDLCRGAVQIIRRASARYLEELADITDGKINVGKIVNGTVTSADELDRIKSFLADRGVMLPDMQEATITEALPTIQDPEAGRVLEIRQLLCSAAVKKFQATIDCANDDWRCRDAHNYYGAGPGRWSGALVQFQNLVKPTMEPAEIEAVLPVISAGDYHEIERISGGDPFNFLSNAVRSIVCAPPRRKLVISDFKGVEARKLAWLAGAETLLGIFTRGDDPYVYMAMDILGCTFAEIVLCDAGGKPLLDGKGEVQYVEGGKGKRTIGKIPFLGAGYQMGWKHLIEVAKKQAGVELTDELAQTIVDTFRNNNPEIPKFWRDIEGAAKWCVKNNRPVTHPKFRFRMFGAWLVMRIPCGRELFYFNPRFEPNDKGRDELVYDSPRGRKQLYGGLLTENITQASSRDLLVDSMFAADAMGLESIMHCHDELVTETDESDAAAESLLHWCMTQTAEWSSGMPLDAETHTGRRYAK